MADRDFLAEMEVSRWAGDKLLPEFPLLWEERSGWEIFRADSPNKLFREAAIQKARQEEKGSREITVNGIWPQPENG